MRRTLASPRRSGSQRSPSELHSQALGYLPELRSAEVQVLLPPLVSAMDEQEKLDRLNELLGNGITASEEEISSILKHEEFIVFMEGENESS